MVEIGLSMFFTLQLLDGPQDVGAPQFIGPKMIWQRGNRSFCFGLGRVHVEGKDKICSVYWYQSESGNLIAVERSDWSTIGFLRGGTSCSAFSDFGSEIKPMTVQKAPYAWHHKNQDGVQCKLWTVPQDKLQVVTMDSIQHAAFAMASMSDALAKEAHHEIRMDESSNQIASVQGAYSIIFNCDGRPPSSVYTDHLPSSFLHVPGPASLAPKALAHHYDPEAFLKKWDRYHITVWSGMVGMAEASHEHAVARCIQGPDGSDHGRKSFIATGGRLRIVEEHEGRRNVLAITFRNKDGSEAIEQFFAFETSDARDAFSKCVVPDGSV